MENNPAGTRKPLKFATLGPTGSCHEYALRAYFEFQVLDNAEIVFTMDYMEALEWLRNDQVDFIMQGCVHPKTKDVIEKYHKEVFVIDSFLYPTQELAVVVRKDVNEPKSFGLMPATSGYVDLDLWTEVYEELSKPMVSQNLLAGKYDAGLCYTHIARQHPDLLRVEHIIGEIVQPWMLYGKVRRYQGTLIGQKITSFESYLEPS
ncbi:hypothetical protein [Saccharospirillum salsuginis]|uniref:Uncharacterized protein n=1 Tax=Saccharospirillum salsuginis TaxID=418750 RepID=A0A918KBZ8_9GAMM|nr:hypothetical protein [Saccharospirillum salsuginis]GGX57522.1 hypothetical protein GCM10007392_26370 [Saccharospirillum salsuginis]